YPILKLGALMFELISRLIKPQIEPLFNREYAQMIGRNWIFSIEKISKLGYEPKVGLDEMIEDSEKDYKKEEESFSK
ncbi:MAG: hypothetical protein ACTSQE_13395, partial [Candidatus Heimdallarchaeaceae archaeon]